jgi:hypothetical protein
LFITADAAQEKEKKYSSPPVFQSLQPIQYNFVDCLPLFNKHSTVELE